MEALAILIAIISGIVIIFLYTMGIRGEIIKAKQKHKKSSNSRNINKSSNTSDINKHFTNNINNHWIYNKYNVLVDGIMNVPNTKVYDVKQNSISIISNDLTDNSKHIYTIIPQKDYVEIQWICSSDRWKGLKEKKWKFSEYDNQPLMLMQIGFDVMSI